MSDVETGLPPSPKSSRPSPSTRKEGKGKRIVCGVLVALAIGGTAAGVGYYLYTENEKNTTSENGSAPSPPTQAPSGGAAGQPTATRATSSPTKSPTSGPTATPTPAPTTKSPTQAPTTKMPTIAPTGYTGIVPIEGQTPLRPSGNSNLAVNEYDAVMDTGLYNKNPVRPLCGVGSWHSNSKEDRQFQLWTCPISDPNMFQVEQEQSTHTTYNHDNKENALHTPFDKPWSVNCEEQNMFLTNMYSTHDNNKEDRQWQFYCSTIRDRNVNMAECTHDGKIGTLVNNYDETFTFYCPQGKVLTGIYSVHDNSKEDRRFSFKCCKICVGDC